MARVAVVDGGKFGLAVVDWEVAIVVAVVVGSGRGGRGAWESDRERSRNDGEEGDKEDAEHGFRYGLEGLESEQREVSDNESRLGNEKIRIYLYRSIKGRLEECKGEL